MSMLTFPLKFMSFQELCGGTLFSPPEMHVEGKKDNVQHGLINMLWVLQTPFLECKRVNLFREIK